MAAIIAYQVIYMTPGALNPNFSSLTPVSGWTQKAMWNTPHSGGDVVPDGTVLVTDVEFSERCGWTFDHWRILEEDLTADTRVVRMSQDNPLHHSLSFAGNDHWYSISFEAFGTYNGTGKVLVSYSDHSKVIRTGDAPVKIFIDQ